MPYFYHDELVTRQDGGKPHACYLLQGELGPQPRWRQAT